jgi:hypothetical protein
MKIVVGGQIDKAEIESLVKKYGGDLVEVSVKNDLDAAMLIKSGGADFYLGACHTGGGGALAMAIALLGMSQCATVSMPGKPPVKEKVEESVSKGARAFGFTGDHKEKAVEYLMGALLKQQV